MSLWVQKYGGTSVASTEKLLSIAERLQEQHSQGHRLVVVLSAMGGETDHLMSLARQVSSQPAGPALDLLLSSGERVSIALLSLALQALGCPAVALTGRQAGILTEGQANKARIKNIDSDRLNGLLDEEQVVVVAGFQGMDESGRVTTLGRGGSDTTAVALAASLGADECHIYTDVEGVYTADPRLVPEARRLEHLTYEEMLEMSGLGSRVLQLRSVLFAEKYNVPLRVLSTFGAGSGTLISEEAENMEQATIAGIAHNRDEAQLTITGVPDTPGVAARILGPIADAHIEVDMIVQNVGQDGTADFTFTVHRNDYAKALEILERVGGELGARETRGNRDIVKVSLVGVGMRSHAGIASRMFEVLAEAGVNISMISTSEIKISVVVEEPLLETCVQVLH
ncbi:MAG: aspartate kinase, partial [Gammaproteobacteria bacterium]|nr:aspartate kinase [Gammaproteobacteria bacterium]